MTNLLIWIYATCSSLVVIPVAIDSPYSRRNMGHSWKGCTLVRSIWLRASIVATVLATHLIVVCICQQHRFPSSSSSVVVALTA